MIRQAEPQDLPAVLALLAEAKLPTAGVAEHFHSFFVADVGGRIVASAGLELRDDVALLRSLAVAADVQGTGLGAAVLREALREAQTRAGETYALTTTAETYLSRFGFERVNRASLPPRLLESRELQDACPASAAVMKWVQRSAVGLEDLDPDSG
jgi:N-acetylglutamate synthase-like GNAT family acetyltransferase